jgi:hypothetical protein
MRGARRVVALALLLALAGITSGTAGGGRADAAASSLPPSARRDLVVIFGPKVKPFGLRLTRAALVNPAQERDPRGTHLALYVEPTAEYSSQDYVDGIVEVTRVFLPSVFRRWKGLQSFDVCQEPAPVDDDRAAPPPETQVFATRAGARLVDWKTLDVATMIRVSEEEATTTGTDGDARFSVFVAEHLRDTPAYRRVAGTTATTAPAAPSVREYG